MFLGSNWLLGDQMRGPSVRPLTSDERAVLARNHRQPRKRTSRGRLSPEVGHLKLADHRDCQARLIPAFDVWDTVRERSSGRS
jgi:hypothetical protein